jgi:hypothetical protein
VSKGLIRNLIDAGKERLVAACDAAPGKKKIQRYIDHYYRYSAFAGGAPLLFLFAAVETDSFSKRLHESGLAASDVRGETDTDIAVGMAVQNMILCAHEYGIGCCVLTAPLLFASDMGGELGLGMKIVCLVSAGYPDEKPDPPVHIPVSETYRVI